MSGNVGELNHKDKRKRPESDSNTCSKKSCHLRKYHDGSKLGSRCVRHRIAAAKNSIKTSNPDRAVLLQKLHDDILAMTDIDEMEAHYQKEWQALAVRRRCQKRVKFNNVAISSSSSSSSKTAARRIEVTQTESVTHRHRISSSESKVERERRPDGTVVERETSTTQTREISVEIKREFKLAYEAYIANKVKEIHRWTRAITSKKDWIEFKLQIRRKYQMSGYAFESGVYAYKDKTLDECVVLHEKQLQTIVNEIQAKKPSVLNLGTYARWLAEARNIIRAVYPTAAKAFQFYADVYGDTAAIKKREFQQLREYKTRIKNGNLKPITREVAILSDGPIMTLASKTTQEYLPSAPIPITELSEEALMDFDNAFRLHWSLTEDPMYIPWVKCLPHIKAFVSEILSGSFSRLYNHILSVQIALRVLNDLPDTVSPDDFHGTSILPGDGLRNPYADMQTGEMVIFPFSHPDWSIRDNWIRVCTTFKDKGKYELILPGAVAMYLFGECAYSWHETKFCPAVVKLHLTQTDPGEESVYIDGRDVPMTVYQSDEFATVRALQERRRIADLEDRQRRLQPVQQPTELPFVNLSQACLAVQRELHAILSTKKY